MATSPSTAGTSAAKGPAAPEIIILAGCLIALISFGPRAASGLFLLPMSADYGWGREVFSLALAVQNLLWGIGSPFAGAIADRYGIVRVFFVGTILYVLGLALMTQASTPGMLNLSAGVMIGFALSGCSFNLVLGAFGKLLPDRWKPMAFGAGTAAGSFGQFLFPPLGHFFIESFGWQMTLLIFAGSLLPILPLSMALATRGTAAGTTATASAASQSVRQALTEAFRHPSYVLLVIGFFTCGFQLAFITVHLPAYLEDMGLPGWVGGWTLAAIGLANVAGSLLSGYLTSRMPKRWILSLIYILRSAVTVAFIMLPASPASAITFGVLTGILWLSTIPPTSALVLLMFGARYMAMLYGFAFFSHQVGGFLGVWLGGVLYESFGSYAIVWWLSVALGVASAVINLPIKERAVSRPQPA
ncbi:MAG: MFS transporter [Chelatococcus sp.]|uniref:MFS transporter n=1 Tax=unclassified Chelatococcus TaxID=2638111 RepID=UPI001BD0430F|nr:MULTISPECIES: MFS transporter [unclassified Chelatococcus]CAH1648672.1 putative MFS family arabinose efflux permease [Hyphomicrobiales bacterium]MBS7739482.1 MFS transporter [Chelatococcus sp. HY11]MBX3536458.1 MFS transporter [Chelatococcus sp.]MBX3543851.1 MFS transporter [Chelatococcus sp.]MCO5075981.1 MFS transporter [Chelatococcus sp.]